MNFETLYSTLEDGFVIIYFPQKYDIPFPKSKVYDNGIYKFCDIEVNADIKPFLRKLRNENARFILRDYAHYYSHISVNNIKTTSVEKVFNNFSFVCSIILKRDQV